MTIPIDIDQAVAFLKADGDDNDVISANLLAARKVCEDYCNRVFYDTQAEADADFTQAMADRTAALAARKTALDTVSADDPAMRWLIGGKYIQTLSAITQRINGIVIDDAINAAILLTLGHLYINREDNVATGNNVVQIPVGAQRILQSKLWIGDLVAVPECDTEQVITNCWGS